MSDYWLNEHQSREERIRELAFRLWQDDGGPHEMDQEYWYRAAKMVDEEMGRLPVQPGGDAGRDEGLAVASDNDISEGSSSSGLKQSQIEKRMKKLRAI